MVLKQQFLHILLKLNSIWRNIKVIRRSAVHPLCKQTKGHDPDHKQSDNLSFEVLTVICKVYKMRQIDAN